MTPDACAHVIEELAQGRRVDSDELHQAVIKLGELFRAQTRGDCEPSADLVDAMGLVQHALQGAIPRLNDAGRARAARLARAVRDLSISVGHDL